MSDVETTGTEAARFEGTTLLESAGWGNPREAALGYAIDSVRSFDSPPSPEHIVERAHRFLEFLTADD